MRQPRDQQPWQQTVEGTKGGGSVTWEPGHQEESGTIEMWALLEEMPEEEREGRNTLDSSFPLSFNLPLMLPLAKPSRKPEHPGV